MNVDDFIDLVNEGLIARIGETTDDLDLDIDFDLYFNEDMDDNEINMAIKDCVEDIINKVEDGDEI